MRTSGRSPVVTVLAWAVALVVPVLGVLPLFRPPEPPPPGPPSEVAAEMDRLVRAGPYDIVVIGDSSAELGIDADILGASLGDPPLRTLSLARTGGTMAPVWYTILRDRVYANGLRPRLVLLGGYLSGVVATRLDDEEYALLREQIAAPDPLVAAKTWRSTPLSAFGLAAERATVIRDGVLTAFRAGPVDLWMADTDQPAAARVTAASKAVFGSVHPAGEVNTAGEANAAGTAPEPAPGGEHAAAATPEETYLPALAALVARNGGRLVVVLPPSQSGEYPAFRVPPELARGTAALASRLGVGWLDARDIPLTREDFADPRHLNWRGARTFTRFLAARLKQIGALETGPLAPPLLPPTYTVHREGTAPAIVPETLVPGEGPCNLTASLPSLEFLSENAIQHLTASVRSPVIVDEGEAPLDRPPTLPDEPCGAASRFEGQEVRVSRRDPEGPPLRFHLDDDLPARVTNVYALTGSEWSVDAYWIYPGTTLRWDFAAPWHPPGARYDVAIDLLRVGPEAGPAPSVTLMGQPAPLVATAEGWSAHMEVPVSDAPWSALMTSPPGGPYVLARQLTFSQGGERVRVIEPAFLPAVDLFAEGTLQVDGELPPQVGGRVYNGSPSTFWMYAPFPNRTGCSPLRVAENGRTLPRYPPADYYEAVEDPLAPGSSGGTILMPPGGGGEHVGERVFLAASDDGDAMGNGRRYTIAFDTDRACWQRQCAFCADRAWLYPGDTMTVQLPSERREPLGAGIYGVALAGTWNVDPPGDGTVHLKVEAEGTVRFEGDIPVVDLRAGQEVPVHPPLLHGEPGDFTVTISGAASLPPILLTAYATQD